MRSGTYPKCSSPSSAIRRQSSSLGARRSGTAPSSTRRPHLECEFPKVSQRSSTTCCTRRSSTMDGLNCGTQQAPTPTKYHGSSSISSGKRNRHFWTYETFTVDIEHQELPSNSSECTSHMAPSDESTDMVIAGELAPSGGGVTEDEVESLFSLNDRVGNVPRAPAPSSTCWFVSCRRTGRRRSPGRPRIIRTPVRG
jgi:hypothetical protein